VPDWLKPQDPSEQQDKPEERTEEEGAAFLAELNRQFKQSADGQN
jgi:hypothetical protein